ncbi:DUF4233 domain-containing protein [Rhodococcus sp. AG1013]|uniref:DUF4233 domain-containing protein n=1 Tax=unclassified Rhodococcus (in: high G+C Gram-positive bacteria) TaxID=192944 RepID=UPI000E0B8772|nr:DUF4233 domain-containing protein [Rhodococcus sp. AG1013]RDI32308.1 uncharacterized protein DUF4233 [Rhodococcus sp. AG1013]
MSDTPEPQFQPPAKDPWKGFRGVMAGTLILEAIVVLLALPVVAVVNSKGLTWASGLYICVLALLMILGAGVQGRPWAMKFNLALQVLTILGFFIDTALGVIGLLFGAVWLYIVYLRKDIARRIERGLLPGQRD